MKLGKIQTLRIVRFRDFGAYLAESDAPDADSVLLPKKQLPEGAKVGDELTVFLYKDSAGRPIATIKKPLLTVGETGKLTIREITQIGAFLDIGLERDVLLPFREREGEIKPGQSVLAALYVDHSGRLAATMRVYPYLRAAESYRTDDVVQGTVYEIRDMGVFVAVDDRYFGLIPRSEVYEHFSIGQEISARVMRVREDGKLDLSPRKKAFQQMGDDAERIMEALAAAGGTLPYGDGSDPEKIREVFGISKSAFKRALGRLLREGKILLTAEGIEQKFSTK
ncbi:putative RNA-binding protein (virulence factor B family) [Moryella indoligenes]|uniref:RNA-binding protein (Virulence factor B family) n=1 Tax=Moryella indoligenes TaxID=371674 RepID=A0AAE4AL49_9FIRM|nr:S1-like domain-containing RNA-binding protein [Moryella indoligenes]MDQ0152097.1 putative RNA-binding protein (virulence factor B family) [Moryella indoligenes]